MYAYAPAERYVGLQGQIPMNEIEIWNQAADDAIASIHNSIAQEALARGLADWLQVIAPTLSSKSCWGPWTWSDVSALDVLSLSVCITDQLFPYDLRNELAGQHLMTLHSPKSGDSVGDPEFRSLWVNAYYRVQRITPISISAPKLPEQELYVRKLLERISYQMMPYVQTRQPPVAVRFGQSFCRPYRS